MYICYFDLQACLTACLHVSDCPVADARHIIVNPLICLVYTNALIWRGVPSTVAWYHKVISVQYIKREFIQVRLGIAMNGNVWCVVCVCVMNNHVFSKPQVHTFRGPHWCEYCANFMWGLIAQGVRCSGNYSLPTSAFHVMYDTENITSLMRYQVVYEL